MLTNISTNTLINQQIKSQHLKFKFELLILNFVIQIQKLSIKTSDIFLIEIKIDFKENIRAE